MATPMSDSAFRHVRSKSLRIEFHSIFGFHVGQRALAFGPIFGLGQQDDAPFASSWKTCKPSIINERDQENLAGESEVLNLPLVLETDCCQSTMLLKSASNK